MTGSDARDACIHLVLLGDSIFDNAAYVEGGQSVADHLRSLIPPYWRVTLLAKDGDVVEDVHAQLMQVPVDATHLFLSIGGNNALGSLETMSIPAKNVLDALGVLTGLRMRFLQDYKVMLDRIMSLNIPLAVCSIYESVPGLPDELKTALTIFNDTIIREAHGRGLPLLDLRWVCTDVDDFSAMSPIEPSDVGGRKIAEAILGCNVLECHRDDL